MVRAWQLAVICVAAMLWGQPLRADLRGHGGPVRALAVSADGQSVVSASFDSTVIVWSVETGRARQVLRFHDGAVNAVLLLTGGRIASGGEDGRIALWRVGEATPVTVLAGHSGPITALASDGARLASASWDGTVRLWSLADGASRLLEDHRANVNGVGFLPGGGLASIDYDGALRIFAADGRRERLVSLGVPLSFLAVAPDGEIIIAAADGAVRIFSPAGEERARINVADSPLATLAMTADGGLIAAAGFRGALALIGRASGKVVRQLDGPEFPLWSLAFSPDGRELITGGADRLVRRWAVASGAPVGWSGGAVTDDIPTGLKNHPGAEVFKACVACHTLRPDGENRAGPTLFGLYGRKIGSVTGYDFSPALRRLNIVWTPETLQELFETGPATYTPGTKMPEQTIGRAEDRKALAEFLGKVQGR